jgi:tRNA G18 (ribose-2'-O)-methylase SpoU
VLERAGIELADRDLVSPGTAAPLFSGDEIVVRTAKQTGLENLPFREFEHNAVWLELSLIAQDLIAWTQLLALDGITNPQNLGMIIRSACAGNIDAILLPQRGGAQIDPLVIKASAGTVFKAAILRCEKLVEALGEFRNQGASVCALSSHARLTLKEFQPTGPRIYVLGNETEGVSSEVARLCNEKVRIPMKSRSLYSYSPGRFRVSPALIERV